VNFPVAKKARLAGAVPVAINKRRLLRDLNAVSRIGLGDHGSVTRLVFSIKELRSRQLLIHLMRQAGLKIHIDRIGNIFGRVNGMESRAPAILAGSHLDTVLHGGKFDGTMGVIGALEAVRTLKENKVPLASPVEVVCFVGEESSRFGYPRWEAACWRAKSTARISPTPSTRRVPSSQIFFQVWASTGTTSSR